MLFNEFLQEHRKVENQESRIQQQEATIAPNKSKFDAPTAGLRKVTTQVEASEPAPQTVREHR